MQCTQTCKQQKQLHKRTVCYHLRLILTLVRREDWAWELYVAALSYFFWWGCSLVSTHIAPRARKEGHPWQEVDPWNKNGQNYQKDQILFAKRKGSKCSRVLSWYWATVKGFSEFCEDLLALSEGSRSSCHFWGRSWHYLSSLALCVCACMCGYSLHACLQRLYTQVMWCITVPFLFVFRNELFLWAFERKCEPMGHETNFMRIKMSPLLYLHWSYLWASCDYATYRKEGNIFRGLPSKEVICRKDHTGILLKMAFTQSHPKNYGLKLNLKWETCCCC